MTYDVRFNGVFRSPDCLDTGLIWVQLQSKKYTGHETGKGRVGNDLTINAVAPVRDIYFSA